MAVLKLAVATLAATAACYSPDLRDCVVSCASSVDCAGGQLCGADHFCASPARAGHCAAPPATDAGLAADAGADAHPPPPDARPDAAIDAGPTEVTLHVTIDGQGTVTLDGGGSCDSGAPQKGNCMLLAPEGVPATLHATPHDGQRFDRWTTMTCGGQGDTCVFVPTANVDVGARFRKADH